MAVTTAGNPRAEVSSLRAVVAFTLGTFFFTYAFIQRVSPSIMTGELMRDFSVGAAAVGSLSAWYFYTYASIQLPVGVLTDRYGPRKLMSGAMLLCSLAVLAFANSESLLTASVSRALVGATVGFGFVGTLAIAGYWFAPQRFALLAGIVQTAGMVGGMIGQAPLRFSVELIGWRGTMTALSALAALLAVLLYFLIPRRPAGHLHKTSPTLSSAFSGIGLVMRNPQSWICAAIGFGLSSIMLGFVGLWAVPWLSTTQGYSRAESAAITSMLFLGWAIAAPAWGWFSDYVGRRKPMVLYGVIGNVALFSVIVYMNVTSTWLLTLLFFASGIMGSSMTVMFSAMRELNSPQVSGTALGLLNMFIVASGAVTQPLAGWILDLQWQGVIEAGARIYSADAYGMAFSVFFASNLLALAGSLLLRETWCRQLEN